MSDEFEHWLKTGRTDTLQAEDRVMARARAEILETRYASLMAAGSTQSLREIISDIDTRLDRLEAIVGLLLAAVVHGIDSNNAAYQDALERLKPLIGPLLD
jgi:hypothetical protein